jgi:hypothetical protein
VKAIIIGGVRKLRPRLFVGVLSLKDTLFGQNAFTELRSLERYS